MENYREPACLYDGQRRLYCEQRLLSDDRRIPSSRFGFFEFFTTYLTTNMNKTGVGDVQVGAQNIFCFSIPKQTQKRWNNNISSDYTSDTQYPK